MKPNAIAKNDQDKDHEIATEAADALIRQMIERIQTEYGTRLQRVMGAGGGLLVVVSEIDAQDEQKALEISTEVPVAVTTASTLDGLQRLGALASQYQEIQISVDETKSPGNQPANKISRTKNQCCGNLVSATMHQRCVGFAGFGVAICYSIHGRTETGSVN